MMAKPLIVNHKRASLRPLKRSLCFLLALLFLFTQSTSSLYAADPNFLGPHNPSGGNLPTITPSGGSGPNTNNPSGNLPPTQGFLGQGPLSPLASSGPPTAEITDDPLRDFSFKEPVLNEFEPCLLEEDPCEAGTKDSVTFLAQDSPDHARFRFDLEKGEFAGVVMDFGNQTVAAGFVLGFSATGETLGKLKLTFEDESGKKSTVWVQGMTEEVQHFKVTGQRMYEGAEEGFDAKKIRSIAIYVDPETSGSETAKGEIQLFTKGLRFAPTAVVTSETVRDLSFKRPSVSSMEPCAVKDQTPCQGTLGTVTRLEHERHDRISFDYDLTHGELGSRDFRTFAAVRLDFSEPIPAGFVFGLRGTGETAGKIKMIFRDKQGHEVTVWFMNLTQEFQNVQVTGQKMYEGDVAGFDAKEIVSVIFQVDHETTGSEDAQGTIEIATRGTAAQPTALVTNQAVRDFSYREPIIQTFAPCQVLNQEPCTSGVLPTVTELTQESANHARFRYDLSKGQSGPNDHRKFAGMTLHFEEPVSAGFVLGFRAPGQEDAKIKLIFQDQNGREVMVWVRGLKDQEYVHYQVTGALLYAAGVRHFNPKKIVSIIAFVDPSTTGDAEASGTIELLSRGLKYVPTLSGSEYNENLLTSLMNTPEITGTGSNVDPNQPDGEILVDQKSSKAFDVEFDLPHDSSFVFADIRNGFFDQNNIFQGKKLAEGTSFVIAARGREGGKVKVEFVDHRGRKIERILSLRPVLQNYLIDLSDDKIPTPFNRDQIVQILFVEDADLVGTITNDLLKVETKGLKFKPEELPENLANLKKELIDKGLDYFQVGVGVDSERHFPYDNIAEDGTPSKFTQLTLIGFYLQMLADVMNGKHQGPGGNMTPSDALTEAELVISNLLQMQEDFGWNGLLPAFIDLDPYIPLTPVIAFGDNANLLQDLAVFSGGLSLAGFEGEEANRVNDLLASTKTYMKNTRSGFFAFYNADAGLFRGALDRNTGQFTGFMDRLANEFRGPIAFVTVFLQQEDPTFSSDGFLNLTPIFRNYTDQNDNVIRNLAAWDGGAFQIFWPLLRNNERDFIGFRNAHHNQFISQADYAAANQIPGFVSASQVPEDFYVGAQGVPQIAENPFNHLIDVGSTYGLASAFSIDPLTTLTWLASIDDQLSNLMGDYGFKDSARANNNITPRYLGIDVGSTVLGLVDSGDHYFEHFMRNEGLELSFNLLYDQVSRLLSIPKTDATVAAPPEFPDGIVPMFNHLDGEGTIGEFPFSPSSFTGSRFAYASLPTQFEGRFYKLDQDYNFSGNKLVVLYSVVNSPKSVHIELKNGPGGEGVVFATTQTLAGDGVTHQRLVIDLPENVAMESINEVVILIDQSTGDTSGDFTIHAMNFFELS